MPELPDVECFRRELVPTIGKTIEQVETGCPRVYKGMRPETVTRALRGHRLTGVDRHGKYILLSLDRGAGLLALHFGLSGALSVGGEGRERPSSLCLLLTFRDHRSMSYTDPRMFGQVVLARSKEEFVRAKGLGPDMLAISQSEFVQRMSRKRGEIKPALMDQKLVAGIGNVYSDEILFQARLHPQTRMETLPSKRLVELYRTARRVLTEAIRRGAESERLPTGYLLRRRKAGTPCPACGGMIERIQVGGRSSYFCPACQKLT